MHRHRSPGKRRQASARRHASQRGQTMRGLLLFLVGALVGANAVYFLLVRGHDRGTQPDTIEPGLPIRAAPSPETTAATTTRPATTRPATTAPSTSPPSTAPGYPLVAAPVATAAATTATNAPAAADPATTKPSGLLVPVAGIAASALYDTFEDARGDNRAHEALDIMAAAGTPVLAVADGRIEKLFDSDNGGLTIYQFEPTGTYVYYYAHLQRYAPGLKEGQPLQRGQVIGYVGSSGNADPTAPHLHFAISVLGPEKRWWQGTAINPYPLFTGN